MDSLLSRTPGRPTKGRASPKYKLVVFDMDQTLFDGTLYEDVFHIVKILKERGVRMAVASYNPYAEWLCDRYGITKYFDVICGFYDEGGKTVHINKIRRFYADSCLAYEDHEIIFFDDTQDNLDDVTRVTGIRCVLVDSAVGITREVLGLILQDEAC